MARRLMGVVGVLSCMMAMPAIAQTVEVVRENVPVQRQVIVANSAEDIALQEEIRKIRAYNAYINTQVGVFDSNYDSGTTLQTTKIELFETPATQVSYVSEPVNVRQENMSHTIIKGDTLYSLARTSCVKVTDIQNANGLNDANLRLGQVLNMPANQCHVAAIRTEIPETGYVRKVMPVPTSINIAKNHNYAVLPKDTLYSIGRQYCVSAGDMAAFNKIETGTAIQPGQILRIPKTGCIK